MPRTTPWTAEDWRQHRERAQVDEVESGYFRRPAGRAFAGSQWSTTLGRYVHEDAAVEAAMQDVTTLGEQRQRLKKMRAGERQTAAVLEAAARQGASERDDRRLEQEQLLPAIDDALPHSIHWRMSWDSAGSWDEPLCRAIKEWAATFRPSDGTQEWEDALMAVAIPNSTTRVDMGPGPAMKERRIGALKTLRWLVPGLSFEEKPGALDPDPSMSVEARAEHGYCVCGLTDSGDWPGGLFCKVHQVRRDRSSFVPPLPTRYVRSEIPDVL